MFKKSIVAVSMFGSLSLFAIPADSSLVIKALTGLEAFDQILDERGIDSLTITALTDRKAVAEAAVHCGPALSRSGTYLKITAAQSWKKAEKSFYFGTSEKPEDIAPCRN